MNAFPKLVVAATLAAAAFAASPAAAQRWSDDDGYRSDWRDGPPSPYVGYGHGPRYNYYDPDNEAGESVIAVCPRGYHLGRDARLCWPN